MFFRLKHSRALLLVALVLALACPLFATQTTKQLANGVTLYQEIITDAGAEQVINCVTVDPKAEGVSIKAALGKDVVYVPDPYEGREAVNAMTGRRGALIGINADFFPFTGDPLGVCVIDGELVSEPSFRHGVFALLKDGTGVLDNPTWQGSLTLANRVSRQIDGINRPRETNQVIVFTSRFDSSTRSKYKGTEVVCTTPDLPVQSGKTLNLTVVEVRADSVNTPIPRDGLVLSAGGPAASFLKENLKPGDKLTIKLEVKSAGNVDWSQVQQAVGGRPIILKNGVEHIDLAYEKVGKSFSTTRHPRTAAGLTADGKVLLVTVDGRQKISRGMSLPDLAALMKRLGAVDAVNLDGGGSTTLSYRGSVINSPSGGDLRPVADALLVFANPTSQDIPNLKLAAPAEGIVVGKGARLTVTCGEGDQPATKEQLDQIVWGTARGNGFVNQQGYFIPRSLKKASAKIMSGQQEAAVDLVSVAGPPAKLDAKLASDGTDTSRATITVTVSDADNNPCAGQQVTLSVTGGKTDTPSGSTDEKGQFTAVIVWDAGVDQQAVQVSSGALTATAVWPPTN